MIQPVAQYILLIYFLSKKQTGYVTQNIIMKPQREGWSGMFEPEVACA